MATLYIAECSAIGGGGNHPISGAQFPPIAEQTVPIGGSAIRSNPVHSNCTLLRLNCDATCSIAIGPAGAPDASVTTARMAANQTEFFSIPQNSNYVVSVIGNT